MTTFFSQFSTETLKKQYLENAKGLEQMYLKAKKSGKKVNGYTADQLEKMYKAYYEKAK